MISEQNQARTVRSRAFPIKQWVGLYLLFFAVVVASPRPLLADELLADQPENSQVTGELDAAFRKSVQPFLTQYCVTCHGPKTQKADRRFDELSSPIDSDDAFVDYQDILDQLNLEAMPPEEAKQPTATERRRVIEVLTRQTRFYSESLSGTGGAAVLRRLNAREYRNTLRDLFQLDMTMFDPTVGFPRDQTTEHLDNVGDTLVTSGHQLAGYLAAAELSVEKMLANVEKPKPQVWKFHDGFRQQPEVDQVHRKTNEFTFITLYEVVGADKHEGAYGHIHGFAEGVPHDGWYEIRVKAEALNRLHPYDPAILRTDRAEPLRLGIRAGHRLAGPLHKPQPIEPLLAERDLEDGAHWYTFKIWLDRGFTPRFTYRNGTMDVRGLWGKIVGRYKDQFPPKKRGGIVEVRYNAIAYGKMPQIRIHEVEIEGPIFAEWPTPTLQSVLGNQWETVKDDADSWTPAAMRRQLKVVADRVYRRPVRDEELDRIMQVIVDRLAAGRTPLEAYGDGVKVLLCSPNFLYLDTAIDDNNRLSPHAMACRLSYFLWSSTPDAVLLELAESGELLKPDVLSTQVERMLNDKRSQAFVNGFLDSWLTLRDLGSTPPDRKDFAAYYHYDLRVAMNRETEMFTRHLLDNNLSIAHFLDSDFTFVNKRLAQHYELELAGDAGPSFERVDLRDRRRGGLFGQASVLTVTANGIDTSPVVRGVWVLENIFGTPPSPPPPDVEPLDPDVRGAKSIRDQLKKHRSNGSCNECHRRIDPLGFALENFDAIGRWRKSYGQRVAIDASGELPGGHKFASVEEFKAIVSQQKKQFAIALTSKLLEYSTGRKLATIDRPQVDDIVAELANRGDGFRDLVKLVVSSDAFQTR